VIRPGSGHDGRVDSRAGQSARRRRAVFRTVDRTILILGIIFFAAFALFPFAIMVSGSFKALDEINRGFPSILPQAPTLNNYKNVLGGNDLVQTSYPLNIRNSLIIAVITVILTMAISLPAALILARHKFWWTTVLSGWVRIAQVVGGIIVIIPLYLILRDLHLVNTFLGVSIAETIPGSAFGIWILTGFIRQIPKDLDDAASIDGAGQWTILRLVIIPLLRPGIVSVILCVFMLSWNDFLNPLILLEDPNLYTITIGLNTYIGQVGLVEWGRLLAVCVLSCIPPILLLAVAERHMVRGLTSGAVKE
jgi:multiple sugar transport system permease protein